MLFLSHLKACKPVLEIKAECYHMETHVRRVTLKDGTTRRAACSNVGTVRPSVLSFEKRVQRGCGDSAWVFDDFGMISVALGSEERVEERVNTATLTDRLRVVRWRDLTPDAPHSHRPSYIVPQYTCI